VGESEKSPILSFVVPYRTSPADTLLTGDGVVSIEGAVIAEVGVIAYDEDGVRKFQGGDLYFLHVEDLCFVTENYRCDLSLTNSGYEEVPMFIQMTDNLDGTYSATYSIAREGQVTVSVVLARQGGLYAEYFNNAFLSGVPAKT
jgi:hypothetical protein